ncbi:EF-hand calcium-binding domain-containing protein 10 [Spea bombifrons]|uniref:EF-hand calcium-binding domain-containing protein 10 n=1 Tax=Spea bombifrons TaxID=233779 RepID=UPI00234A4D69|nr:EF-hand calcium-binding domain-containing protein 10 [Spea bombifrons]
MAAGRELEAKEYLRENKIMELMNNLTSLLLYHRPERPREFLINELEKLKLARIADVEYPCLFDESNLDAVFRILDPSGQGYITGAQFMEASKTLGVNSNNFVNLPERITLEVFKYEMRTQLKKACATFRT